MTTILSKDLVSKWIREKMEQEYSITVYPQNSEFGEKFTRWLTDNGWSFDVNEDKIVLRGKDPIEMASMVLEIRKKGYFVTTE